MTADEWQSPEMLARLTTRPVEVPPGHHLFDVLSRALEHRLLWPLAWFGLLE